MAKTSLEKSHSKASNFKLTMICLLAAISLSLIFVGIAIINKYKNLGIILAAAGGVMTILSYLLISRFTR